MTSSDEDIASQGEAGAARLVAVGDLLLPAGPGGSAPGRDMSLAFSAIREALAAGDIVFGNLECTLPGDGGMVPTEPRVISSEEMVRAIQPAGFHVVSLANNHAFDCLQPGFHKLRGLLDEMGISYFGAGDNLEQAAAPAILEARGIRVAFLGMADERSGAGPFASADHWGVAPLDIDRLTSQIRELRGDVHHVIISPHWGEERFLIPSPEQVEQARQLIDAGASMVLGHHPHVVQGLELRRGRPIAYSLGNFVACEVPYADGDAVRWNRTERTGCVLLTELTATAVRNVAQTLTYDDGARIQLDRSPFGRRRIAKANRAIRRAVTARRYRRERLWAKTIKPILQHLRWSELREVRPRHFLKAVRVLLASPRG
jgi:poly-gamma-glutamate synthesis protein (capsule biosynthesis protein)